VTRTRFLLQGLLKLIVASLCLVGAIAAYRLLVHPAIERALSLNPDTSSIVRRIGIFAVMILSYAGFVRFYERRAPRELAIRPLWTVLAAVAGVVSIGMTIAVLYLTGHYEVVATRGLGAAGSVLGTLSVAAVLEELAFRCILFRVLEERIGTNLALVVSALVFGVVHLSNNGAGAVTLITVTEAGLMWGLVFVLTRNLWASAAHHFCWNSTIFLIGLPLSGESDVRASAPLETVYRGATLWTGGAFGPEDSLINLVVSAAIVYLMWRLAARCGQILSPGMPGGSELATPHAPASEPAHT
jgi:membrane protease YdiL (CAAX protease family)